MDGIAVASTALAMRALRRTVKNRNKIVFECWWDIKQLHAECNGDSEK